MKYINYSSSKVDDAKLFEELAGRASDVSLRYVGNRDNLMYQLQSLKSKNTTTVLAEQYTHAIADAALDKINALSWTPTVIDTVGLKENNTLHSIYTYPKFDKVTGHELSPLQLASVKDMVDDLVEIELPESVFARSKKKFIKSTGQRLHRIMSDPSKVQEILNRIDTELTIEDFCIELRDGIMSLGVGSGGKLHLINISHLAIKPKRNYYFKTSEGFAMYSPYVLSPFLEWLSDIQATCRYQQLCVGNASVKMI